MDPITMAIGSVLGSAISGGASLLGGQQSNAANAQQAMWNNIGNAQLMQGQFNLNNVAAHQQQAWTQQNLGTAMDFNSAQAQNQMRFQDFEMDKATAFNSQEAVRQRAYETQMSNTAYQRAVKDMKAAGLNPIVSAGTGGASTPMSASPSIGVPGGASGSVNAPGGAGFSVGLNSATSARMSDVFSPAVSNALQGAHLAVDLASKIADVQNRQADTANKALGPPGSIFNPNVAKGVIKDVVGSDAAKSVGNVLSNLFPPPSPSSAATVSKQMDDLGLGHSNLLPSGAPANIPSLVPGALGAALKNEIKSWLVRVSPPTTSHTPGNPGTRAANPVGVTGGDLYDYAQKHSIGGLGTGIDDRPGASAASW